jgi:hypothetical protein
MRERLLEGTSAKPATSASLLEEMRRYVVAEPRPWDNESDENVIDHVTPPYDFFDLVQ